MKVRHQVWCFRGVYHLVSNRLDRLEMTEFQTTPASVICEVEYDSVDDLRHICPPLGYSLSVTIPYSTARPGGNVVHIFYMKSDTLGF